MPATIKKIADFLGKTLTDEQISRLSDYVNIENFRKNPSVNYQHMYKANHFNSNEEPFIRNGKTTSKGWQKEYTPEIIGRVEIWMKKNLQNTSIRFPQN